MANLQIEIELGLKLAGVFGAGIVYFYTLKNSFNILHERQKVAKTRLDNNDIEIKEIKETLTILKTQHEAEHCKVKK